MRIRTALAGLGVTALTIGAMALAVPATAAPVQAPLSIDVCVQANADLTQAQLALDTAIKTSGFGTLAVVLQAQAAAQTELAAANAALAALPANATAAVVAAAKLAVTTATTKVANTSAIVDLNIKLGVATTNRDKACAPPTTTTPPPTTSSTVTTTPSPTDSNFPQTYANCTEVRAAGKAPLARGETGYRSELDADGDGFACELVEGNGGVVTVPSGSVNTGWA